MLLLLAGTLVVVAGAELIVEGARRVLVTAYLSETFLGMTIIGMGESLEETARMVTPARRGHPELAWGNVVGAIVILLAFNLGVIALVRPITVDPVILRFHVPYLIAVTVLVGVALLMSRHLGRAIGAALACLYILYLVLNVVSFRS